MKILALDAGLGYFSAALDLNGTISAERSDRNDALEAGLARISRLLVAAELPLRELDRIAVGIGPGSFTGIRIALSFAKALAYGAGLPLVGVSSYDAMTPADVALPCLTIVAGRPGVICARLLDSAGAVTIACGPTRDVFDRLLSNCQPGTALTMIGNTEDVLLATGERHLIVHPMTSAAADNPAATIARLARRREASASSHALAPDYGELPAVSTPSVRAISSRAHDSRSRH